MIRVAISLVAALLGIASTMSQPAAQALGPDEAHDAPARVRPNVTLSPAQKRIIYNAVLQPRLRTSPADIPLIVGALVPRSAMLLMLPDHAAGASSAQFLKYAMVYNKYNNVVVVDSISLRVIDIIRSAAHE
jgi:hypothetical protein